MLEYKSKMNAILILVFAAIATCETVYAGQINLCSQISSGRSKAKISRFATERSQPSSLSSTRVQRFKFVAKTNSSSFAELIEGRTFWTLDEPKSFDYLFRSEQAIARQFDQNSLNHFGAVSFEFSTLTQKVEFELLLGTIDSDGARRTFVAPFEADEFYHEISLPYHYFREAGTPGPRNLVRSNRRVVWVAIRANSATRNEYQASIGTQNLKPAFKWNRVAPTIDKLLNTIDLNGKPLFVSTLFGNFLDPYNLLRTLSRMPEGSGNKLAKDIDFAVALDAEVMEKIVIKALRNLSNPRNIKWAAEVISSGREEVQRNLNKIGFKIGRALAGKVEIQKVVLPISTLLEIPVESGKFGSMHGIYSHCAQILAMTRHMTPSELQQFYIFYSTQIGNPMNPASWLRWNVFFDNHTGGPMDPVFWRKRLKSRH